MPNGNKTTARALRMTDARKTALTGVRRAAFNSGAARSQLLASVYAACGKAPVLALADAVRFEVVVGLMAASLARRGDNRPENVLTEHCRSRLTLYQGFGGKAKLRKGMKGRRTKVEEEAYASARVQWSGIAKEAGVKLPTKSGSNSTGRKPRPSKANQKPANDTKPVARTFKKPEAIVAYALQSAKGLQMTLNRSAKIAPQPLGQAIQRFVADVIAIAKEAGVE